MRAFRSRRPLRGEIIGIRAGDAPVRWLSVNSEPVYDEDVGAFTGVLATFVDVTEQRASFDRIRELLQRLDIAQEKERRDIALTLHEGVAQDLYAMRLLLRLLDRDTRGLPEAGAACAALERALEKTMVDVRQVATDLRPTGIDRLPLGDAIRGHASYFGELTELRIEVRESGEAGALGEQGRLLFFRGVQEALTNVSRHAHAKRVTVSLQWLPARVELRVEDDGVGISPAALRKPGALGLLGLQERCRAAGGSFGITGRASVGTELRIALPIRAQAEVVESTLPA